ARPHPLAYSPSRSSSLGFPTGSSRYTKKSGQSAERPMPADPHVALRDPEAPGDVRGPERVRIGQGEDLAILRVQSFERLPDLVTPLLRNQGAQGVVRGFRGRGAEAAEGLGLPARRAIPPLADVDGGLEKK